MAGAFAPAVAARSAGIVMVRCYPRRAGRRALGLPRYAGSAEGFPPGPVASPGEKALITALRPDQGDWFWFVTIDPEHRITKFTDTESEFVRYREELNRYLGKR